MARPRKEKQGESISGARRATPIRTNQIDLSREVEVVNLTPGGLFYRSPKSGRVWDMAEFGSSDYMTVDELKTMLSAHPQFLREPWLLILDEEVIAHLNLSKVYENVYMPEEVDKLFDLPLEKFKALLETFPLGMRHLLVGRARVAIDSGRLDSRSKISAIEKFFNVQLSLDE